MPDFDPQILPQAIADYFATAGTRNALALFSADAIIIDEGETYRGLSEIAAWLESVEQRYRPRYALQDVSSDGEGHVVTFQVSGTFPGSPAVLRQRFEMDEDARIGHLRTL